MRSWRYCIHWGMALMGNPNPENVMVGMMKKNAVTMACCCVDETVEMSSAMPSMQIRKSTAPVSSTEMWPRNGI